MEISNCKNCGQNRPIVNRTHWLCPECNKERLYGSEWRDRKQSKVFSKIVRASSMSKKNKSSNVSKNTYKTTSGLVTQAEIELRYKQAKQQISEERGQFCESCGRSDKALSFSHIIGRQRAKEIGKAELIWNKDNILIECYTPPASNSDGCHNQHEADNIRHHKTYDHKLEIYKRFDPQKYTSL